MKRFTLLVGIFLVPSIVRGQSLYEKIVDKVVEVQTNVDPEKREKIRYFSLFNIPEQEREVYLNACSAAMNFLSNSRTITRLEFLPDETSLVQVDLSLFEIPEKQWEEAMEGEPYFSVEVLVKKGDKLVKRTAPAPWTGTKMAELVKSTGSYHPIVRTDWFLRRLSDPKFYYKLRNTAPNWREFKKKVGITKEGEDLSQVGIILDSQVTNHEMKAVRTPTVNGYVWVLSFSRNQDKSLMENLLEDGSEDFMALATLPNGLYTFFAGNSEGKRVDYLDPSIAMDFERKAPLKVGIACLNCHHRGALEFSEEVRSITKNKIALVVQGRENLRKTIERFSTDFPFQRDQNLFQVALSRTGISSSDTFRKAYFSVIDDYEKRISLEKASKEIGLGVEIIRGRIQNSNNPAILSLLMEPERPMRRDQWEKVYGEVMLMCYKK